MPKPMNFDRLEGEGLEPQESAVQRWRSREADPTVQMSVRMHASTYDRFRLLAKRERRTNGDMLEELMRVYLSEERGRKEKPSSDR